MSVLPLYAFVQGDTMGVVVLGRSDETVAALAERLLRATDLRAHRRGPFRVVAGARTLPLEAPLGAQGIQPLERIDLVWE